VKDRRERISDKRKKAVSSFHSINEERKQSSEYEIREEEGTISRSRLQKLPVKGKKVIRKTRGRSPLP